MINIQIIRKPNQSIEKITVDGHSGYAEEGSDIVCSAISALTITTVNGLTEIVGIKDLEASAEYGSAFIDLSKNTQKEKEVDLLMETLALGFEAIEGSYPEFISIQEFTQDKEKESC